MINELYELSKVMERYGVQEESYALNYNEISYKECICVTLDSGEVLKLSQISNMQNQDVLKRNILFQKAKKRIHGTQT